MKEFFSFILIIKFIKITITIVPVWDFNNSVIDLFSEKNSYEYTIYSNSYGDNNPTNVELKKQISRNNGVVIEKNILKINDNDNNYEKETDWEDIESIYTYNYVTDQNNQEKILFICPKGKNHLNEFEGKTKGLEEITPKGFAYNGTWELKCYKQKDKNYLFVAYLNKYDKIYAFIFKSQTWHSTSIDIYDGLFDFKWTIEPIAPKNNEYPMRLLMYNNSKISLETCYIILEKDNDLINTNHQQKKEIINSLLYSNAYFNYESDSFYFITFNLSPFNYTSGYYNGSFEYNEVKELSGIKINSNSPFQFYNEFIIKHINLTRYTQYVLYEMYDTFKNISYYGIVDIVENKVIFNTDEEITSFKRFKQKSETGYSFLAITEKSAYRICALADNNKNCISSCSSGSAFINSQGQNFCGDKCPQYIMEPTGICINECDSSIFHLIDNYKCGFCKDVSPDQPFKLLNSSGCLKTKREKTYFYKPEFKILDKCHDSCKTCFGPSDTQCEICEDGYYNISGKCAPVTVQCHEKCSYCLKPPEDDNQNCLSCKDNLLLQTDKGNCVEECNNGYFQNDTFCEECKEPCKACYNSTQCITCINGFYFNDTDNQCYQCDSKCEICKFGKENDNEHCIKCLPNKFLINETEMGGNCVDECPEGTIAKDGKCKEKEQENANYMIYVFIIIIITLLILISINIIIKCYNKKKQNIEDNDVSMELQSK